MGRATFQTISSYSSAVHVAVDVIRGSEVRSPFWVKNSLAVSEYEAKCLYHFHLVKKWYWHRINLSVITLSGDLSGTRESRGLKIVGRKAE